MESKRRRNPFPLSKDVARKIEEMRQEKTPTEEILIEFMSSELDLLCNNYRCGSLLPNLYNWPEFQSFLPGKLKLAEERFTDKKKVDRRYRLMWDIPNFTAPLDISRKLSKAYKSMRSQWKKIYNFQVSEILTNLDKVTTVDFKFTIPKLLPEAEKDLIEQGFRVEMKLFTPSFYEVSLNKKN